MISVVTTHRAKQPLEILAAHWVMLEKLQGYLQASPPK